MSDGLPSQAKEMLRRLFVPTTTESYKQDDEQYRIEHEPAIQALRDDLETVEEVMTLVRSTRSTVLRSLHSALSAPTDAQVVESKDWKDIRNPLRHQSFSSELSTTQTHCERPLPYNEFLLGDLCGTIKETKLLRSYANELEKSIDQYRYLVNTQATADRTGYRELRDWAKGMLQMFEYLMTILISISTVGAGLVYATIFSASRGNIGFMCLTFPLFTVGFLVPVTAQISLRWASNLPNPVQFASQIFWKYIIIVFMTFAVIAVLTALVVLNITIFFLEPMPAADSLSMPEISSGAISIPGIVAFAFSASVFFILFGAFALSVFAKGLKAVISPWYASPAKRLNNLESFKHI
ncbi:hypothetical protein BDZ97DRAFT_1916120 [Flammula alnicola]|nr:hypothetical protein BDZ97DRAFT_1916120 [Flammula alnicola]